MHATERLGVKLSKYPAASRVILETCAEAFAIADAAKTHGHDVRIVPATLVRTLGVGARGIKTDQRDARVLSEVSTRIELPSVHLPSGLARELKAMCTMRETLVECRTKLINSARGYLRTQALAARHIPRFNFADHVRKQLRDEPNGLPVALERLLLSIEELTSQIENSNEELQELAKKNETCKRLMSVPGVGPVTSVRFLAAIDDIGRFPSAHAVESYLGLTPGEDSSSMRKKKTSISKAGAPQVRWALGQACWVMWRHYPSDPLVLWSKKVAERRGRAIGIVAMTRKLAAFSTRCGATAPPTTRKRRPARKRRPP